MPKKLKKAVISNWLMLMLLTEFIDHFTNFCYVGLSGSAQQRSGGGLDANVQAKVFVSYP